MVGEEVFQGNAFDRGFERNGLVGFDLLQFNKAPASFISAAGFCSGSQL